jgi:SAM-dependent methyltransferase
MSPPSTPSLAADAVARFEAAAPDRVEQEFRLLADAVWRDGRPTPRSPLIVPDLVSALGRADEVRRGYLAVLLGLLAETAGPQAGEGAAAAVRRGLDVYLALLGGGAKGRPDTLALLYLVSHFPQDRERVLGAVRALGLDPDDATRLERALGGLDPSAPDIGRVWPSPSVWSLDESELEFDQGWFKSLAPEQLAAGWSDDTATILGYSGAKAYWAVRNNVPVGQPTDQPPADEPPHEHSGSAPEGGAGGLFAPHADAFRCPACGGGLAFADTAAHCPACSASFAVANGILSLVTDGLTGAETADDLLIKLSATPRMGLYYEALMRPAFLRVMGSNWDGGLTPLDEDAYLAAQVRPAQGPVLDLAAGAGRWTEVLARTFGAERVIALDMAPPMLNVLRGRLPGVASVLGSAFSLPFGDATLGAVVCWNALQALPGDVTPVIAEAARCLRPGGTFTLLTYHWDQDPVYRHFQKAHRFPQHPDGMRLFELDDLLRWLADAGLAVREQSGPGTFVLITAERTAPAGD